ncbi:hypothetical protein [uncultured Porphyromonas sp.]|jgi:hypothetical protein|uniref:hypothetical protein n=1 Tax=uncultured Porphyromonas sp. TaxID=159274 RepID=UPI00280521BE|nr:hypothetical protein [uncultured Porphyromonas sp.]
MTTENLTAKRQELKALKDQLNHIWEEYKKAREELLLQVTTLLVDYLESHQLEELTWDLPTSPYDHDEEQTILRAFNLHPDEHSVHNLYPVAGVKRSETGINLILYRDWRLTERLEYPLSTQNFIRDPQDSSVFVGINFCNHDFITALLKKALDKETLERQSDILSLTTKMSEWYQELMDLRKSFVSVLNSLFLDLLGEEGEVSWSEEEIAPELKSSLTLINQCRYDWIYCEEYPIVGVHTYDGEAYLDIDDGWEGYELTFGPEISDELDEEYYLHYNDYLCLPDIYESLITAVEQALARNS